MLTEEPTGKGFMRRPSYRWKKNISIDLKYEKCQFEE
jgi:hypothetical protein